MSGHVAILSDFKRVAHIAAATCHHRGGVLREHAQRDLHVRVRAHGASNREGTDEVLTKKTNF